MLLNTVVHDLYRTSLRVLIALLPLLVWYPAWGLADTLWRSLLLSMQPSDPAYRLAYSAWPSVSLLGPALVMAIALALRRSGVVRPSTAFAAVAGMACGTILTGWPEARYLISLRPSTPWLDILRVAHLNVGLASGLGMLATGLGGRVLFGGPLRRTDFKPIERARTDTFGHADWMPMKEATALFNAASGPQSRRGVVVGEAYRVDEDPGARSAFDPRNRATWARAAKRPCSSSISTGAARTVSSSPAPVPIRPSRPACPRS